MSDYEIELLGFYRSRLAESWALLELATKWMPAEMAARTHDHVAKARALTAKCERLREEQWTGGTT